MGFGSTITTLLLAAVCSIPVGAQQAPSFPDLDRSVRPGDGRTQPCLESVEGEVLCGRFRVLEDPELEDGRTIDLAFVVLRALNGRSFNDAVTLFNGGPGAAVTPVAAPLAQAQAALRAERDILLLDHRGTAVT